MDILGQGLVTRSLHLQPGHDQLGVIVVGFHTLELFKKLGQHMRLQLALSPVKEDTECLEDGKGGEALVGGGHLDQLMQELIAVLMTRAIGKRRWGKG